MLQRVWVSVEVRKGDVAEWPPAVKHTRLQTVAVPMVFSGEPAVGDTIPVQALLAETGVRDTLQMRIISQREEYVVKRRRWTRVEGVFSLFLLLVPTEVPLG